MGRAPRQTPARLAEKLLFIRTKMLGLSQNEMIRRLGFEGELIQSHISAYEQENEKLRREPPLGVLLQYARVAKTSVENLIDDRLEVEENVMTPSGRRKREPASTLLAKKTMKSGKRSAK